MQGAIFYLLTVLIWGSTWFAIKFQLGVVDASLSLVYRFGLAALLLLAMQAAGSAEPGDYASKVEMVANAPGEQIFPGELAKGLQILADGGDIDYVGATAVEFVDGGEAAGSYRQIKIEGGKMVTVQYR